LSESEQQPWTTSDPGQYLGSSLLIDVEHPIIRAYAAERADTQRTDEETARETFEFVRDRISHSWDIQSRRITARASEAMAHREGICYAKSHLLAALLRAQGIPAGICYQRLTFDALADSGFCVHALNTVYLSKLGRWIRIDARGNKDGVDAQFSVDPEQLAFPVRPEIGECNYWTNYIEPHPKVVETLLSHEDCRVMYADGLPTEL
jgi:transglutaminase-like putative cysteine protease